MNGNKPIKCVARCAALLAVHALFAQPSLLLPPFPDATHIHATPASATAQQTNDSLVLPIAFTDTTERIYWDIPLAHRIDSEATTLELELACTNSSPIRSLSLHLRSGEGWYAFPTPLLATPQRQRITLPKGAFIPEGSPHNWHKATHVRLSAWRQETGTTTLQLFSLRSRIDSVAMIRATALTAPNEIDFAASLANRCARLLTKANIPFALIDDACEDLSPYRMLLLPYAPQLPENTFKRLQRYLAKGGKLMVFYNASKPLGALLGVRPGPWQGSDPGQEWSALIPVPHHLPAAKERIPHFTNSVLPPFPTDTYQARIVAFWSDATGRTTDLPACLLSDRGAWFAHVAPLATPAAVTFIRTLTQTLCPNLSLPPPVPTTPITTLPPARPTERRGAWESSGFARHPRGWEGLLSTLSEHGINTVFAHWQSAGTAHYQSNGKRMESDHTHVHRMDPLEDALLAGKKHHIALHAWVTCWTLEGCRPSQRETLTREGRLMQDAAGNTLPWLCPSIPANRQLLIEGYRDLARRGVAGIHLDYIRFPEETGCYAPATRTAFETELGKSVVAWPADVLPHGPHHAAFRRFRFATMTSFVRETRDAIRAINPEIQLSAAVFPTPEGALLRGQDWPVWVEENLIDFVCPMIYSENIFAFSSILDICAEALPDPTKTLVPGIGSSADESQLDAAAAALQIKACRERHLPGFAFFAVDDALLSLLPQLFP